MIRSFITSLGALIVVGACGWLSFSRHSAISSGIPRRMDGVSPLHVSTVRGTPKNTLQVLLPDGQIGLPEELRLVLRPAKQIELIVVDGQQQPVADAHVFLMAAWDAKLTDAKSDGAGKASLVIPVGAARYAIVAMKPKVGFDYWLYRSPTAESEDGYRLPRDEAGPLTFVLNGARHVVVKLLDADGRPVPGISVAPWTIEKPRKGSGREAFSKNLFDTGVIDGGAVADFRATSNERGEAIFDYFPADGLNSIGLRAVASGGYRATEDHVWIEAGSGDAEATMTLLRQMPLEIQVTYNDGRPAPGTAVFLLHDALEDGRPTPAPKSGHGVSFTDEQGVVRRHVFANDFQLIRAWREKWAAPLTTNITRDEPPQRPLRIVLQPATRLHGRLRTQQGLLLAGQSISALRHMEEAHRRLRDANLTLKRSGRAVPHTERLLPERSAKTNDHGEFEFFLGPGRFQLRYGEEPPVEVEVDGQAELQVDFNVERASEVEFAGRVVYFDREQEGVAGATVRAYYLPQKAQFPHTGTVTNSKGAFHFSRPPVEMVLYARDDDGRFAGTARVAADDDSIILNLQPATLAKGRLIDATSDEPLRNVQVVYGVQWEGPSSLQECGGMAQTDERGGFVAAGLLPGQQYRFFLSHSRSYSELLSITPKDASEIDLGTYRTAPTRGAALDTTGPVAAPNAPKIYDTEIDGEELVGAALKQAKAEQKRVLLVFGANWSAWCHRLEGCFKDNEATAARLREGYVVARIDVDNWNKTARNLNLAQQYQIHDRLPVLVMLDADGQQMAIQSSQNFENEDHYDHEKLLAFLNQDAAARRVLPVRRARFPARPPAGP